MSRLYKTSLDTSIGEFKKFTLLLKTCGVISWTMPRPRNDKIGVSFLLPRKIKQQLDTFAVLTRRTRSAYVEIALEEQFKKDGAPLKHTE